MNKKHPCPDCRECLWCSDDRCRLCLKGKSCRRKKQLPVAEQIALYEEINRRDGEKPTNENMADEGG